MTTPHDGDDGRVTYERRRQGVTHDGDDSEDSEDGQVAPRAPAAALLAVLTVVVVVVRATDGVPTVPTFIEFACNNTPKFFATCLLLQANIVTHR